MEKYNVVFATDENYVQHVAVALVSLLKNNQDINITINYILDEISNINKDKLINIASKYERNINFFTLGEFDLEYATTSFHFNKAVYFRLVMADTLPLEKVLYLDADVVVVGSVKYIFDLNIENNFLAAVIDPGFSRHNSLNMIDEAAYFNAGVFFANLNYWRTHRVKNKCLQFMHDNYAAIELADQDVLNSVVNGNWVQMPAQYNQQSVFFEPNFENIYKCILQSEIDLALKNPVIIHYSGSSKPWHFRNAHPQKALYWKYRQETPFSAYLPDDLTLLNIIKWSIPKFVNSFLKYVVGQH